MGDILYYEMLDNGLQVFMVPKDNVNTTFVSFNVQYGAIHNEFIPLGETKMIKVPNGIAHFLEHKMFEQEDGIDPMLFYAANGADVNAYTSLYNTAYHFSCADHLKENVEYLLNFVQAPYFTDENVEKEKGIIEEEIKMYADDPYSVLDDDIRLNVFKDHPIRYSIAGTVEDINAITRQDLYTCYKTFYHPSNMFLVISGKVDVDSLFNIIRDNQNSKKFEEMKKITLKSIKESDNIVKEYEEKQLNVEVPKLSYGIKIPLKGITMDPKKRDIYVSILFDSLFGGTSTFNEEMRDKGYLLSSVMIDKFHTDSHLFITVSSDTEHVNELVDAMKKRLNNIDISEDEFEGKRRMFISNDIYIYENVEGINRYLVNDLIIYGKYYTNTNKILNGINKNELDNLIQKITFDKTSVLVINPIIK